MKHMGLSHASRKFVHGVVWALVGLLLFSHPLSVGSLVAAAEQAPVAQSATEKLPSGVGKIELQEKQQVVLKVSGIVDTVHVDVGDQVNAGDILVELDTQNLEWAVQAAEMNLESARIQLAKLNETVDEIDVALAESQYLLAQENLAVVEAGPTEEQLQATRSSLAAAQAAYSELLAGPSETQLTQAQANLRRAEITLQEAQREYDEIAWRPDAGATSQSANLQQATISYEAAKAAFEETTEPARASELQSSLATLQRAQDALNELEKKPTSAEVAAAQANLAEAEAALAKMRQGPDENDLRLTEISVEQALTELEQARLNLANAEVTTPINGTVLAVNVEPGEQASAGTAVVTIADTAALQLVVNVEQRDIPHIRIGQEATVSVYALGDQEFSGVIELIVPVSDESSGLVTYPVTLQITNEDQSGLLPGMTATATFTDGSGAGATEATEAETATDATPAESAADAEGEEPDADAATEAEEATEEAAEEETEGEE